MTLTHRSHVEACPTKKSRAWLLVMLSALALLILVIIATGVGEESPSSSSSHGSGASVTDRRDVAPFTTVELAGTNALMIHVGAPQSVEVTGDDNLVGRFTTVVEDGRLVISDAGSFTTKAPTHVVVSTPSLDGVVLSGDGAVTVDGVSAADFTAELTGDGTLDVSGTAQRVVAVLAGDGMLDLHDLLTTSSTAHLEGTGSIRVHVTGTLDATLIGTGTIRYRGDPVVTTHGSGTGAVVPD
jgi:Putative auto-transporter adhesin, head GIN domain